MSVRERVVRSPPVAAHVVQFFDSVESRAESVAAFLRSGYRRGGMLLAIASPSNWTAISARLQHAAVPVQNGRVVFLDTVETLDRISRRGTPDATLFDHTIGAMVTRMGRAGRLYCYGEMVDLLAQRGDLADAILLEAFWNRLASRTPVSLMCGYAAAHFVAPVTHRSLRDICAAHTHVDADQADPLAAWLLSLAQSGRDTSLQH
jgi:hypothetical protein